jgi:hypothetical protein
MRIDSTIWRLGFWFAAVRLVALWSMIIGFQYGDWHQLPGSFLSMLILPELFIVSRFGTYQQRWQDPRTIAHLAVLIFFASYFYAWVFARLRRKAV